jgi:hypothetical protein
MFILYAFDVRPLAERENILCIKSQANQCERQAALQQKTARRQKAKAKQFSVQKRRRKAKLKARGIYCSLSSPHEAKRAKFYSGRKEPSGPESCDSGTAAAAFDGQRI